MRDDKAAALLALPASEEAGSTRRPETTSRRASIQKGASQPRQVARYRYIRFDRAGRQGGSSPSAAGITITSMAFLTPVWPVCVVTLLPTSNHNYKTPIHIIRIVRVYRLAKAIRMRDGKAAALLALAALPLLVWLHCPQNVLECEVTFTTFANLIHGRV